MLACVGRLKIIFIGKPRISCLNFIVADSEEMAMEKLLKNFLRVHGTVLEVGCQKGKTLNKSK